MERNCRGCGASLEASAASCLGCGRAVGSRTIGYVAAAGIAVLAAAFFLTFIGVWLYLLPLLLVGAMWMGYGEARRRAG